jgi:beta-lactamase class A
MVGQETGQSPGLESLEKELVRLAAAAQGIVGVGAMHLESGRSVYLNGQVSFPMGSTVKVPIALELLRRVDRGEVRLDSLIVLRRDQVFPRTYGPISEFIRPGSALTVRNLLELMLQVSDNNGTDILLLGPVGGPERVTSFMQSAGLGGIRVDRSISVLIAHEQNATQVSMADPLSPDQFLAMLQENFARTGKYYLEDQNPGFDADPRDTATPRAMADLLAKVWRREILSEASSALLIDIMYGCKTGERRLRALLPTGTRVAHKTGTINRSVNDVGIIDLPGNAGHVVTVVFVKESRLTSREARENVIAQIARAVHDYFTFTSTGS